jgi:hypothetical protein
MPKEQVEAIPHAPTNVEPSTPPDRDEKEVVEEECLCWDGIPRVITSAA